MVWAVVSLAFAAVGGLAGLVTATLKLRKADLAKQMLEFRVDRLASELREYDDRLQRGSQLILQLKRERKAFEDDLYDLLSGKVVDSVAIQRSRFAKLFKQSERDKDTTGPDMQPGPAPKAPGDSTDS